MTKHTSKLASQYKKLYLLIFGLVMLTAALSVTSEVAYAACTAPSTDYGTATQTVNIPSTGNYRVWSRIKAPDATNNSYLLEVDGGACVTVGDTAIPANTWTWVDYQNGSNTTKTDISLTAGNHTFKMIGREANVSLDKVIFIGIVSGEVSCVPIGDGSNCSDPTDTTQPNVSITSPQAGNIVSGTRSITASAFDDVAVSRVEFLVDGSVINNDTNSPYSYNWDTTTISDGVHSLVARAYDAAGNVRSSSAVNVTVSNNRPDLVVTAINFSPASPNNGNAVTFSATIRNQGTAATTAGTVHGVVFSVDGTPVTWSDNNTSALAVGASRTLTANGGTNGATWAATAGTHTILANVDDVNRISESTESNNTLSTSLVVNSPDTTAPSVALTAPANGATATGNSNTISATASDTGGSGVARVAFYVGSTLVGTDSLAPYSLTWDSTTITNGSYAVTARAYDGANNTTTSASRSITINNPVTPPPPKTGDVNGDNLVTFTDLSIVLTNRLLNHTNATLQQGDVNGDRVVNFTDVSLTLINRGK